MSVAARKMVEVDEFCDEIQYWICIKVEADCRDEHVYFIEDSWYRVTGYISSERDAIKICGDKKRIAEMVVHNYDRKQLHAPKKTVTFKRWAFIKPVKAP